MSTTPANGVRHFLSDSCWICDVKFDPNNRREDHHIVPRAYGGVDGPQVSICDSHHTTVHHVSLRLFKRKPYQELLTGVQEKDKKILYLATVACNARLLVQNDPNRRAILLLSLKGDEQEALKRLKNVYPRLSREALVKLAIKQLYQRSFSK